MDCYLERDCPACGITYRAVTYQGVCPKCYYAFSASPTHIALAGKLGKCSDEDLLAAIAKYHDIPYLSSLDLPVCDVTARQISEVIARENRLIPILVCGQVRVAIPDPMIPRLSDVLTELIGSTPCFAVASFHNIANRINDHYGCLSMFDSMKAFVYGLGRGSGIRVTPRHHHGETAQQLISLASDILAAEVSPTDDECNASRDEIATLVRCGGDPSEVSEAIRRYVLQRLNWINRDTQESSDRKDE